MDKKIIDKIINIRKEIIRYNHIYYNLNKSIISDYEYDKKIIELIKLEKKYPKLFDINSPTNKLGSDIDIHTKNIINYKYRMYSLQNVYSKKELKEWSEKINNKIFTDKFSFLCEFKYDGVSVNIIYKKGILHKVSTRGNGSIGEDITRNIRVISSIPLKLYVNNPPTYIEVRGEVCISNNNFKILNNKQILQKKKLYSNPRNTVSGILKMKSTKIIKRDILSFIAFHMEGISFTTQYDMMQHVKYFGFKIPEKQIICKNINNIHKFVKTYELNKDTLCYPVDGIVIKINEIKHQIILGCTNKYPKWSIAYKFKQNTYITKLVDLIYQIGRTGVITPVAKVNTVFISGTKINRVSLYNKKFYNVKNKSIHYGDIVLLKKAGDVIPKITHIHNNTKKDNKIINFISKCPSCNHNIIQKGELFYCVNNICLDKKIMKFYHFVSSNAMNIKYIGVKTIKKLIINKKLNNFFDFFLLKKQDLFNLSGISEKLSNKIITNIYKSKYNTYYRLLFALGIRYVGEDVSKKLLKKFFDINGVINASHKELLSIYGIGDKIATSIKKYFSDEKNVNTIKNIVKHGFYNKNKFNNYTPLYKKSFIFTGKLNLMTRNRAKNIVERLGGIVYNSVRKNIDFIVVGDNFGSKLKKVKTIKQIKILTEHDFLKKVNITT